MILIYRTGTLLSNSRAHYLANVSFFGTRTRSSDVLKLKKVFECNIANSSLITNSISDVYLPLVLKVHTSFHSFYSFASIITV